MIDNSQKKQIIADILPAIEDLVEKAPRYGEISLKAKLCDYKVGTTFIGFEFAQKTPKNNISENGGKK